jgi:hypothetical protein
MLWVLSRELLKGESDGLLLLPSDKALIDDPAFRPFVEIYAKVQIHHLFQKCNM